MPEQEINEMQKIFPSDLRDDELLQKLFQSNNIYSRRDIQWYTKFNRFGVLDPYNSLTNTREYLFFTKPDLHIYTPGTNTLNPQLSNNAFFVELSKRYPDVILQLQKSAKPKKKTDKSPFIHILSNSVKNTLDLPEITTEDIDTPATIYGTQITYRGNGFSSDEAAEATLEFEDTKYLELYHFFKAYDEYERLKRDGIVSPPNINNAPETSEGYNFNRYLEYKELHDQFSVYKFIVDEDYETIVYYAYGIGVYPKSVPREAFSDVKVEGGLRYQVPFKIQFIDDMKPYILVYFNQLIQEHMGLEETPEYLDIYNDAIRGVDGTWARAPWIVRKSKNTYKQWLGPASMQYDYKLKWRMS